MQISYSTQSLHILLKIDHTCLFQFSVFREDTHSIKKPARRFAPSPGRRERYPRAEEQRFPPPERHLPGSNTELRFFPSFQWILDW